MNEFGKMIAKSGRSLMKNKSWTRFALEKSTRLYVAAAAIVGGAMVILDAVTTFNSNVRR